MYLKNRGLYLFECKNFYLSLVCFSINLRDDLVNLRFNQTTVCAGDSRGQQPVSGGRGEGDVPPADGGSVWRSQAVPEHGTPGVRTPAHQGTIHRYVLQETKDGG